MAAVMAMNAVGLKATARLQLGLAGLLAALLLVAIVTALPESRGEHWTPFAPHGWAAVGTAASLLMLSFIGWETVSHLAGDLRDPARQLPRAIFSALAVVVVLYLGLAVASDRRARHRGAVRRAAGRPDGGRAGRAGPHVTAALAVLLTMGAMNAYVAAATRLAGALAHEGSAPAALARPGRALALIAIVAGLLLAPLGTELLSLEGLVRATSASFVAVYVIATAAGVRLLAGSGRLAAAIAFVAVAVVLGFSGVYVLVPAVLGVAVLLATLRGASPALRTTGATCRTSSPAWRVRSRTTGSAASSLPSSSSS